jgi:putative transposase
MPQGLRRFQESRQSHFVTFSCYRRQANFTSPDLCDLFVQCLEDMRQRYSMCVYGYVVMPEHVHLLVCEPDRAQVSAPETGANLGHLPSHVPALADAIHYLKLSFAKRLRSRRGTKESGSFWQKRYYDRNVRDEREFSIKLRYLHRNPVKRGLVADAAEWQWSSFRHYALREVSVVEIESAWLARDRETRAQPGSARVFLRPG